ncbi:T9SS type A sorting domain-containing protein [Flavobacterium dankookense]|uniref:Putative secreted protein (Por secretion system target) n=1 Tax=Flavobacterium dankookense TaxID=706186 RepID=A0A4R6Q675_9FLAO|nr:T9SS type A sorting domain-containing protein [Flavobacterium dankookense]TDP57577.1 putative secreted protein (Por secretion system target) [Flavobacterium dankookense]
MKKNLLYLFTFLFSFNCYSQVISMIGSTSPSGSWAIDTNMNTTDNVTYTLNNVTLTTATDPATTGLKFRQDGDWAINWGNSNFPSGTGVQNGPNIMTIAGTYDVTFNRLNGTYTFIQQVTFPTIGIWGPAVDSQNGYGGDDVDMITNDGIVYTLADFNFSSGQAYFRENNNSQLVYGSTAFPVGTAVATGPSIPVTGGEYFVTFNRTTGEYRFDYPSIGILGSALGGFGVEDTDLSTTDGFVYTINDLQVIDGEVKFRKNNSWATNWGSVDFPSGTGTQNGPNIPIGGGFYDVTFERDTGNYQFVNSLSVNESAIKNLKVYPNPSSTDWTITHTATIDRIQLFDVTGKELQSFTPIANDFAISSNGLSQGVYFLKISSGLDFSVQKIIKN